MTDTLTGPANALGEHMSDISEDVYAAGWISENEWVLWRALQQWRREGHAYWNPNAAWLRDITEHMPKLDELQRKAGGWVWWLEHPGGRGGMQFVDEARWLLLVEEKNGNPGMENEALDRRVPAASLG